MAIVGLELEIAIVELAELARVKDDIDLVDGLERRASDVETLIER